MDETSVNDISGILLGKYHTDALVIDLPLVTEKRVVKYGRRNIEKTTRVYGEFSFPGDLHYGNKVFAEEITHAHLNYYRQHKNILLGTMGDIIECAALSRFISEEKIPSIDNQIEEFVSDWRPLADRIRFMLWGNHEEREAREAKNTKLMPYIKSELGAENATIPPPQRGLFIIFKAGEYLYGCHVHHSKTQARINQDLQLRRAGSHNLVAIVAHGHTHRLTWKPRTFFDPEEDMVVVRRQYLLATGCFLEYPSYAEARSMPLTEVGAPIVRFYADNHQLECYDLTTTYRNYIQKDGAGAGSNVYDHASRRLNNSFENPFKVNERCLL